MFVCRAKCLNSIICLWWLLVPDIFGDNLFFFFFSWHYFSNKNVWMLVIPYSITLGVNVAWSSVLDINVAPFGISQVSCHLIFYPILLSTFWVFFNVKTSLIFPNLGVFFDVLMSFRNYFKIFIKNNLTNIKFSVLCCRVRGVFQAPQAACGQSVCVVAFQKMHSKSPHVQLWFRQAA